MKIVTPTSSHAQTHIHFPFYLSSLSLSFLLRLLIPSFLHIVYAYPFSNLKFLCYLYLYFEQVTNNSKMKNIVFFRQNNVTVNNIFASFYSLVIHCPHTCPIYENLDGVYAPVFFETQSYLEKSWPKPIPCIGHGFLLLVKSGPRCLILAIARQRTARGLKRARAGGTHVYRAQKVCLPDALNSYPSAA